MTELFECDDVMHTIMGYLSIQEINLLKHVKVASLNLHERRSLGDFFIWDLEALVEKK